MDSAPLFHPPIPSAGKSTGVCDHDASPQAGQRVSILACGLHPSTPLSNRGKKMEMGRGCFLTVFLLCLSLLSPAVNAENPGPHAPGPGAPGAHPPANPLAGIPVTEQAHARRLLNEEQNFKHMQPQVFANKVRAFANTPVAQGGLRPPNVPVNGPYVQQFVTWILQLPPQTRFRTYTIFHSAFKEGTNPAGYRLSPGEAHAMATKAILAPSPLRFVTSYELAFRYAARNLDGLNMPAPRANAFADRIASQPDPFAAAARHKQAFRIALAQGQRYEQALQTANQAAGIGPLP
jgi:hypothetical protein